MKHAGLPILLAVVGVATPFVILWLRHRALAQPTPSSRAVTDSERQLLRKRGRYSIVTFVLFWVVSLTLVTTSIIVDAGESLQWTVVVAVLMMAGGGVALHFRAKCPVCGYRLGYQRTLGIPGHCERCDARF